MRDTTITPYEQLPSAVLVSGNDYRDQQRIRPHRHQRGQLLYASAGVVTVRTAQGQWVVPPQRALWIPAGIEHAVRMDGPVAMRSAYVRAEAASAAGLPTQCRVLAVSALLHALLLEAVDLPPDHRADSREGRVMGLILDEVARMPVIPLSAPLPQERRLRSLCQRLLETPARPMDVDDAAARCGMSRRQFTRLFRQQTGISFIGWRQQSRLLAALVQLGTGASVTQVALELGYDSPSAFTAVFRRVLGEPPSRYLRQQVTAR